MGTINNDSCLDKIRRRAGLCAICGRAESSSAHVIRQQQDWHRFKDAGDEPIFVLRAQDVTTVPTIQDWLKRNPDLPPEKREEALRLIDRVLVWPKKKVAD